MVLASLAMASLSAACRAGAGGDASAPAPDAATLSRLREATGIRRLELDPDGRWVRKLRTDVECAVSALAAGYATDRIAELLAGRGLTFLYRLDLAALLLVRNAQGGFDERTTPRFDELARTP